MNHIHHISQNKRFLEARAEIVRLIRQFFWQEGFLEVETPNIVALPGQEPYLDPMIVEVENEVNKKNKYYLHTSPEYTLKKMLAAGFGDIFTICKVYRNKESFGGLHNPEFTMLEFYRTKTNFWSLMDDLDNLVSFVSKEISQNHKFEIINLKSFRRIHMRDLWQKYVGINLDDYLDNESMNKLCQKLEIKSDAAEAYEDLFYKIFLNKIEPNLIEPTIVHHYPAQMAALSRFSEEDLRYAERFEIYINGLEIANAFTELTDKDEQRKRLAEEKELRRELGREVYNIDEDFLEAVDMMPECAGIALGVDRFVMTLLGCQDINNVLTLPASKL